MKIGNPAEKPALSPVTTRTNNDTGKAAGTSTAQAAAPEETTVELSSAATKLLSGDSSVSGDFDAEKVARIAQAISDGKFEVNPGAIADKLLANAREVLGKSQH